jgi:hypothetical protein
MGLGTTKQRCGRRKVKLRLTTTSMTRSQSVDDIENATEVVTQSLRMMSIDGCLCR